MLRVPTRLGPSSIHGLGIFAVERIPAGTVVWDFDPPIDQRIRVDDLAKQPDHVQRYAAVYGYREGEWIVLCGDDARFMNHSKKPNCQSHAGATIARRDIEPGEELTDDYETFDADWEKYRDSMRG
ncbi:MAG TPA: SET domain-containing protein-lysine N-methyltransferase [Candidatus Thermoplasmatota archaeon]|nr:SET domain-containing protein-lysine N-methyltransferase [Candidatus Thermoplasmatota archaeon]